MNGARILRAVLLCCSLLTSTVSVVMAAPRPTNNLTKIQRLGKELFFDKISQPSWMDCSTCHGEAFGWTGPNAGLNVQAGIYRGAIPTRFGDRKPPSAAYSTFSPVFHYDAEAGEFVGGMLWDGRATGERLGSPAAEQAIGPWLNPVEQNMPSKQAVCERVSRSEYTRLFEEVWGPGSLDCSEMGVDATYDKFGLSIAAYEGSREVSPFSSKYDFYWSDCLAAGNDPADCGRAEGEKATLDPNGILTALEWDGLIEFGEYCADCHVSDRPGPNSVPPLFTDFKFDNIGVPRNPDNPFYGMNDEYLDDGTPINPLGQDFVDYGLGGFLRRRPEWAALAPMNDGKFKVPSVRNVAKTRGMAPKAYMHNGVFKNLKDVVHFYNTRDVAAENWPAPEVAENVNRELFAGVPMGNFQLDEHAENAIVAFLGTLNDGFVMLPKNRIPTIDAVPVPVTLGPNRPNPFNPQTQIHFSLAAPATVKLAVYDLSGRLVSVLANRSFGAGEHAVLWRGQDDLGRQAPSGIYVYRIEARGVTATQKMVLLK